MSKNRNSRPQKILVDNGGITPAVSNFHNKHGSFGIHPEDINDPELKRIGLEELNNKATSIFAKKHIRFLLKMLSRYKDWNSKNEIHEIESYAKHILTDMRSRIKENLELWAYYFKKHCSMPGDVKGRRQASSADRKSFLRVFNAFWRKYNKLYDPDPNKPEPIDD